MLTISIDPIAFNIGSLEIRWYGIMIAIAVVSVLVVMVREAKRRGITSDIYSICLSGIAGGLVGGRIPYVIYEWDDFVANPLAIVGFQGLAQNGMVIGIIVAGLIYMRVTRMRFSMLLSIGDALAVGAPLALAIGRIGCTINGCCHGVSAPDLPWAVVYTHPDSAATLNVPVHPTTIYHLLWNLIVFAIVWRLRGRLKPEGSLFFFFLCILAVGDFGIRFFRTDEPVLGWLRQAQVLDMAIVAVFLPWLIFKMRRFHEQASVAEMASQAEPEQNREG